MGTELFDVASVLIGKDAKLKDLKAKGLGPDNGAVAGWAVAWSHYAVAGDALVAAKLDSKGFADVNGVKIGPDNTVDDLLAALKLTKNK
jgi:hypothetical protein